MSMTGILSSLKSGFNKVEEKAKANPKATLAIGTGAVIVTVISSSVVTAIVALAIAILAKRNPKISQLVTRNKRFIQMKRQFVKIKKLVKDFLSEQREAPNGRTEIEDTARSAQRQLQETDLFSAIPKGRKK